jgi:hypothetical protein
MHINLNGMVVLSAIMFLCFAENRRCYAQPDVSMLIDSAMVCLVKQRYETARETVEVILEKDPGNIDALYMLLTIKQTRILDYESYTLDGATFVSLADSVYSVLKRAMCGRSAQDSLKILFYLGNISGGKSLMLAKCGNWFAAAREAMISVAGLKEVKQRDSTFFAAYLGIGVFDYYLSQNLGWVPFLGDKSDEGLYEIRIATRARFPFNYAAKNSLSWILVEKGSLGEADSIVNSVLRDYPDNTIFLRIKGRETLMRRRYDEAIAAGKRLTQLSVLRNPVNWCDCITGCQIVVEAHMSRGDTMLGRQEAVYALKFEVPSDAMKIPYIRKHLAYLRDVAAKQAQ